MSLPPDFVPPAMQNFVQAGQTLAQNFLAFLNTQQQAAASSGAPGSPLELPDTQQLASLQQSFFDQQSALWS